MRRYTQCPPACGHKVMGYTVIDGHEVCSPQSFGQLPHLAVCGQRRNTPGLQSQCPDTDWMADEASPAQSYLTDFDSAVASIADKSA